MSSEIIPGPADHPLDPGDTYGDVPQADYAEPDDADHGEEPAG